MHNYLKIMDELKLRTDLEAYFQTYAEGVIGNGHTFKNSYGLQRMVYADWVASGRLYAPIENILREKIGPMVANTHSFSSETGKATTYAYKYARQIIKNHVHADKNDVLVTANTGMTGVLSHLQRIMGLRFPNVWDVKANLQERDRPVVFISHMEHHSNHVPWLETIADVVILESNDKKLICPHALESALKQYSNRRTKIGSFTACSNVTGIITPFYELARIMHRHGGKCFVDFAASAPYVDINMHPEDDEGRLDAIFFSPHKFLGGPGTCGVLVFNRDLYNTQCPDVPGGGNVQWTNPWGDYAYFTDIEVREDGGTPGFLQVMRAALAIRLKDKMGTDKIEQREKELLSLCFHQLRQIPNLYILGSTEEKRIGCISFTIKNIHYNLIVRLLNDRFGIQLRGGWSCASTYGHYLFDFDKDRSGKMVDGLKKRDLTHKPGWVRLSLHPITTNRELFFICDAIKQVAQYSEVWGRDYSYNRATNEFEHMDGDLGIVQHTKDWFVI
ncbi:aminotransferase class V-fold PLP-dependent enzyme [Arenibacter sp. M-2]|uniref:aminotransferase class V-fold PLP-dependent enzyme n=1 Tax=Arenibacter sp. M-2 TaxID=3053612 RepID=UPI0025702378|nr:aminotransferase class V-fold PLP-dependent enzyme [Arenibacter sp. M-2]MDL5513755.1 aminotransferase class V-fold PLP-dependent enzyme [Arenibacter sp. M-2]